MTTIILGIGIGVTTSFLAGMFLIWKGEEIVQRLRRLPSNRRVTLFARAYISALHSYPYRYLHIEAMALIAAMSLSTAVVYGVVTFLLFSISGDSDLEFIRRASESVASLSEHWLLAWISLAVTLLFIYATTRFFFRVLPVEIIVPYAHRELERMRECVAKCGTKKQFLEYTDAEERVRTRDGLIELVLLAKTVVGNLNLDLADEIIRQVTKDVSQTLEQGEVSDDK